MTEKQHGLFTAEQRAFMRWLAGLPEEKPAKRLRSPDPLSGTASMIVLGGLNAWRDVRAATGTSVSMQCCQRVSRLIEVLQRANLMLQSSDRNSQACEELIGELNSLSRRYKWSPAYRASETGLSLSWHFPDPENWEDIAVSWIRELVENHTIHRLRCCAQCPTWFYAATEHQRFCVEKCRKKHASESPIFKEKRRRYMAEVYRPREKHAEMAALETRKQRG